VKATLQFKIVILQFDFILYVHHKSMIDPEQQASMMNVVMQDQELFKSPYELLGKPS